MATTSNIEWTDATWNCLVGCAKVSAGCLNCYAMIMAARIANAAQALLRAGKTLTESQAAYRLVVQWERGGMDAADLKDKALPKWNGRVVPLPSLLDVPLRWRKPRRVFVNSMSDLFHESVPDEFIAAMFGVMAACPLHTFQILTKRAQRMAEWCQAIHNSGGIGKYIRSDAGRAAVRGFFDAVAKTEVVHGKRERADGDPWMWVFNAAACTTVGPLLNVQLGVSCERQPEADERIPWLLKTPAAVRFVSAEPLLGPIELSLHSAAVTPVECRSDPMYRTRRHFIDWVIVGGESGHDARECELPWIRSIVEQCQAAAVPVFVKQLGSLPSAPNDEVADWFDECGHLQQQPTASRQGEVGRIFGFRDRKGGDPSEWPSDLRVREFPRVEADHA